MVHQPPTIVVTEDNDYVYGRVILYTVRMSRMSEKFGLTGTVRTDFPVMYSRNRKVIQEMIEPLSRGDFVVVKGSLCTADRWRDFRCPECGAIMRQEQAVIVYVDPLDIMKVREGPDISSDLPAEAAKEQWDKWEEDAFHELKKHSEIGNLAMIMGRLTRDPVYYSAGEKGKKEIQFQIVSPRRRRILEDPPEKNADFPWVKAFGDKALEYYDALHEHSRIYINGAIETRVVTREIDCEECGNHFSKEVGATEIVPYDIEYLEDCYLPESTHLEYEDGEEYEE